MRLLSAVVGLVCMCAACQSGRVDATPVREAPLEPAVKAPNPPSSAPPVSYGSSFEPATTVPLSTLLSNPQQYADQTVTTEGRVQRACSRKGCWMEVGEGDDACRVTFKDYGFFVPTDSAGAQALIQGKLSTRVVEAAAVEHLESEGARFKSKKPDGSALEVRLIATAVELRR